MKRLLQASLAVSIMLAPTWAAAYRAANWLRVNPVSEQVFEVVGKPGSGPVDYWCAAGDYARQVLNASATQRIYIVRGRAQSVTTGRKSAVQFSLAAPQGADTRTGLALSVTQVGANLNAASARAYCDDLKILERF